MRMSESQRIEREDAIKHAGAMGLLMALRCHKPFELVKAAARVSAANRKQFK